MKRRLLLTAVLVTVALLSGVPAETSPDADLLIANLNYSASPHLKIQAMKALSSLKALSDDKAYPVDLAIGGGRMALSSPDDRGEAEIAADTGGEAVRIRLAGSYLSQALKACGGMVEMKLTSPSTPVLFTANGYQLVVMPMVGRAATVAPEPEKVEAEASKASKSEGEPPTEPAGAVEANPEAEAAIAEAEAIAKAKPKRKRKARELAGVA